MKRFFKIATLLVATIVLNTSMTFGQTSSENIAPKASLTVIAKFPIASTIDDLINNATATIIWHTANGTDDTQTKDYDEKTGDNEYTFYFSTFTGYDAVTHVTYSIRGYNGTRLISSVCG